MNAQTKENYMTDGYPEDFKSLHKGLSLRKDRSQLDALIAKIEEYLKSLPTPEPQLQEIPTVKYMEDFCIGYHFKEHVENGFWDGEIRTSVAYIDGKTAREEDENGKHQSSVRAEYNRIQSNRVNFRKGGE